MKTQKVLVVDDDRQICDFVRMLLEDKGFSVSFVTDGLMALEVLAKEKFDVVLLDYRLPGLAGDAILCQAKLTRHTKVFLMTAHVSKDLIKKMFDLGISGYIAKPFGADDLLRHFDFHLNRAAKPDVSRARAVPAIL